MPRGGPRQASAVKRNITIGNYHIQRKRETYGSSYWWHVTHLPTGSVIFRSREFATAEAEARKLSLKGGIRDWNGV